MNASGEQDVLHLDTFNRIPLIKERVLGYSQITLILVCRKVSIKSKL